MLLWPKPEYEKTPLAITGPIAGPFFVPPRAVAARVFTSSVNNKPSLEYRWSSLYHKLILPGKRLWLRITTGRIWTLPPLRVGTFRPNVRVWAEPDASASRPYLQRRAAT